MTKEKPIRLDRFLANNTALSRKEVKRLLKEGVVCVDGKCQRSADFKVTRDSEITLEGQIIRVQGESYLMLNKPAGYVCANSDGEHPVVFDLLYEEPLKPLHVVGRLDIDTTGLVLLTSDGAWSHRVTSPNSGCGKVYRVELAEKLTEQMIQRLQAGVFIGEEQRRTKPAKVEQLNEQACLLTIQEGRYHQVKRMFASVGNRVTALHRCQIGGIQLDQELPEGDYRALTKEEVASVG